MKSFALSIYIAHYTKLVDRKTHMDQEISKWSLDKFPITFETRFDQEVMTDEEVKDSIDLESFKTTTGRPMKKGEQSLSLKYKSILSSLEDFPDDHYVLVLEDDVVFKEDPVSYISSLLSYCDSNKIDFDCVFMGEAWMRRGDNRDIFFHKDHPATNGLCTVLYKVSSAKRVLSHLNENKVSHALDWHFNRVFEELDFNVYWAKAITSHGSVTAMYDENKKGLKSVLRDSY